MPSGTFRTKLMVVGWLVMIASGAAGAAGSHVPEASFDLDGSHYDVIDGMLFEGPSGSAQKAVQRVYDPEFHAKNFAQDGNQLVRLGSDGEKYPVKSELNETFENTQSIVDLIGLERGWTEFTVLAPATRSAGEYSALRHRILQGKSQFIDNRVEPSSERAHSGATSLRTYSVASKGDMQLTKASLGSSLFHFKKGDDFWYSAWYFLEKGRPWSLVDLESTFLDQGGGMRLMLTDDLRPFFQLKWPSRPEYRTQAHDDTALRPGVWTHIKVHFLLSEGADGVAQLWIDDHLIIDAKGQTLPVAKIVYDSLEVGNTANPPAIETILFIDDIKVSHEQVN